MPHTARGFLFALIQVAAIACGCFAPAIAENAANALPIPLPPTAEAVEFDGNGGKLEFYSTESVATLATFYRTKMKPLDWKEET
jgi:hypothetical protein